MRKFLQSDGAGRARERDSEFDFDVDEAPGGLPRPARLGGCPPSANRDGDRMEPGRTPSTEDVSEEVGRHRVSRYVEVSVTEKEGKENVGPALANFGGSNQWTWMRRETARRWPWPM